MTTAVAVATVGCTTDDSDDGLDEAVQKNGHIGNTSKDNFRQHELVRYATLAPSSHNTQCWKFQLAESAISIVPDLVRRCPVVDPDDHHLFVSLGCATENLVLAAEGQGMDSVVKFESTPVELIRIAFQPTPLNSKPTIQSSLFAAIPQRQSTRCEYDGKPLNSEELSLLEKAGSGDGVHVQLLTDRPAIEQVLEYVIQGNTTQLNDPAFVNELKHWIRFSDAEAIRKGDGLWSRSTGNPSIPRWLAAPLLKMFLSARSENDKYAKQVRSSAGIAVFSSDANDKSHWMAVGRCFQRFALQATVLGIRTAHINQPVEVAALRSQFASALGIRNRRPDLVVRFGHGPLMPQSRRRSVDDVIIS